MSNNPTSQAELKPVLKKLVTSGAVYDQEAELTLVAALKNGCEQAGFNADWLRDHSDQVSDAFLEPIIVLLKQAKESDEAYPQKQEALKQLRLEFLSRFCDPDTQFEVLPPGLTDALHDLVDQSSKDRQLVRDLVNRWVNWIAKGKCELLVQCTADVLRDIPEAVLPLVGHFARPLELTASIQAAILKDVIDRDRWKVIGHFKPELLTFMKSGAGGPGAQNSGSSQIKQMENEGPQPAQFLEQSLANEVDRLVKELAGRSFEFADLKQKFDADKTDAQHKIDLALELLFKEELAKREVWVYRRITSLLAHMSDKRFYENKKQVYKDVRKQLKKHALPVIVFNLPGHTDLETRWHVGLMLGYIGGRKAVDPLVQVLIDEQNTRNMRQKVLSEYYLEPSRRHSQEATEILDSAVQDARTTMKWLRRLNVAFFCIGILILLTGITFALVGGNDMARSSGFIAAMGGIGGIVAQFLSNPLDRIQKGVANLVQIETAFTSFIFELHLNGTYIQSRYVADGKLLDDEIEQTLQRMEKARSTAMELIAIYSGSQPKMAAAASPQHQGDQPVSQARQPG